MAQEEIKPDLASLVAEIAREECKKLYESQVKSSTGSAIGVDNSGDEE